MIKIFWHTMSQAEQTRAINVANYPLGDNIPSGYCLPKWCYNENALATGRKHNCFRLLFGIVKVQRNCKSCLFSKVEY